MLRGTRSCFDDVPVAQYGEKYGKIWANFPTAVQHARNMGRDAKPAENPVFEFGHQKNMLFGRHRDQKFLTFRKHKHASGRNKTGVTCEPRTKPGHRPLDRPAGAAPQRGGKCSSPKPRCASKPRLAPSKSFS